MHGYAKSTRTMLSLHANGPVQLRLKGRECDQRHSGWAIQHPPDTSGRGFPSDQLLVTSR
jgi:hypothetical protein